MRFILILLLLVSFNVNAQCKEYITGVNGDKLNCVDMNNKKQGRWVIKVDNLRGERGYEEEGVYKNNLKEGDWRRYSLQGDLIAYESYRWGNKDGKNVYYDHMGNLVREESWRAVNPDNPYDTVNVYDPNDPTMIIGKQVIKLEGFSLKHGTWKFYDSFSGNLEETQKWFLDKPANEAGNAAASDEELMPIDPLRNISDTSRKNALAKPQAILDYEKKNSGKKKIKVRDGRTGN
ncbi:MAG: hypothetical protein H0V30_14040 [Chitinophagaceae bacterium]|jgi:hypothetical protein|nr:hypothetical protein [Chitinophagaceae bacterium]